jgi:hypothetical protein
MSNKIKRGFNIGKLIISLRIRNISNRLTIINIIMMNRNKNKNKKVIKICSR